MGLRPASLGFQCLQGLGGVIVSQPTFFPASRGLEWSFHMRTGHLGFFICDWLYLFKKEN